MRHVIKKLYREGILINSIEPLIEDAIIYGSLNLLNLKNFWLIFLIGSIELVGIGQALLILQKFSGKDRFFACLLLPFLMLPFIFLLLPLGEFLSEKIDLISIYGSFTILSIIFIINNLGGFIKFGKFLIPLPYIIFSIGFLCDIFIDFSSPLRISLFNINFDNYIFNFINMIFFNTLVFLVMLSACITIALIGNRINRILNENDLKRISTPYMLTIIFVILNIVPSYIPLFIFFIIFISFLIVKYGEKNGH